MNLRRLGGDRDLGRLRDFLRASDPMDYLLEDFSGWTQRGRLWVGEEGADWLAFGRLHDLGEGEGWVSGVRVLPSHRGLGLGGQLLDRLILDAHAIGISSLRAVIEDRNTASRRLFGRFGFHPAAELALRRGPAREDLPQLLRLAGPQERPDGPVGWLPALTQRVDLLPGSDGGRFGGWRPSLLDRWAAEGKLYVGRGIAVAVQMDWWRTPHTLWINPLQGTPDALLPALGHLTHALAHEEWQGFLPSTEELRSEYARLSALPHPSWGDRVHLYELGGVPRRGGSGGALDLPSLPAQASEVGRRAGGRE